MHKDRFLHGLSVWAVHTGRSSCWMTASSFRQQPIYSLFHGFSSIRTAVAPSLSLDQRHGTCSKTICVSRTCKLTVFVVHWRRFFLDSRPRPTRHIERIRGVIFGDNALYKFTFIFTNGALQSRKWQLIGMRANGAAAHCMSFGDYRTRPND